MSFSNIESVAMELPFRASRSDRTESFIQLKLAILSKMYSLKTGSQYREEDLVLCEANPRSIPRTPHGPLSTTKSNLGVQSQEEALSERS